MTYGKPKKAPHKFDLFISVLIGLAIAGVFIAVISAISGAVLHSECTIH